jgi:hypothetical protein
MRNSHATSLVGDLGAGGPGEVEVAGGPAREACKGRDGAPTQPARLGREPMIRSKITTVQASAVACRP